MTFDGCAGEICQDAFNGCTGITTIHLPASLELLSGEAFFGMPSLSAITVDADNPFFWAEDGVLYFIDSDGVLIDSFNYGILPIAKRYIIWYNFLSE